jgi:anti-sigma factor RsiW
MRLFSFDDPRHRDVMQLLPRDVNGTLDGTERARVEDHVRQCVACRGELDAQLRLSDMVRGESVPPAMAQALARLHGQIDSASPARARARWPWWQRPSLLGLLVAVQFAVILALLLMTPSEQVAPFRTLSAPPSTGLSRDAVVVVFDPAATQQRVQALLGEIDARIVAGPNARGAYTLELPAGRQAAALERMRAAPDVHFAQPAPGSVGMDP